jgi:DNA-binding CsgD family transcriptional regulator/pimeloyl-ACP methyl ester carboxylesterase
MPARASHAQLNWSQPGRSAWLEGLKSRFTLICYDSRGQGMSTRGLPDNFSLSDFQTDLETVIGHLNVTDFILDGSWYFGHVAIQYAVARPERVKALVLQHCSLVASASTGVEQELLRGNFEHYLTLLASMMPSPDRDATVDFLQQTITREDLLRRAEGIGVSEITAFLPDLHVPTLLLHARGFTGIKREEASRFAARIPVARLVLTEGSSAMVDASHGLPAIDAFLRELPRTSSETRAGEESGVLSGRELEVLRLLAAGKSNQQIADDLVISLNTVRRHVSNIFDKTGVANRTEAATYAARNGLT